jgi:hypothetical protein
LRADDEHQRHYAEDHEQLDLRQQVHGCAAAQADDKRAGQRTANTAEPADDDDGERKDDDLDADPGRDRQRGRSNGPGNNRESSR